MRGLFVLLVFNVVGKERGLLSLSRGKVCTLRMCIHSQSTSLPPFSIQALIGLNKGGSRGNNVILKTVALHLTV